jgi:hypothetical protein
MGGSMRETEKSKILSPVKYFYRITAGDFEDTIKAILLRLQARDALRIVAVSFESLNKTIPGKGNHEITDRRPYVACHGAVRRFL